MDIVFYVILVALANLIECQDKVKENDVIFLAKEYLRHLSGRKMQRV